MEESVSAPRKDKTLQEQDYEREVTRIKNEKGDTLSKDKL